ncbi:hypothetical protein BT96DRAFT_1058565 [Gymnopus androsaceus JB14]|uniref:DUF6697 domain-containing protein n=1 Tax=Gymnopus androsaceus JB14 TaxID=1447944 RepID=A0A6A4H4S9_9AGAR|nr:hypothetical protein BT96DRAFT_1058565 [Gymnopus androsaceus JB14]
MYLKNTSSHEAKIDLEVKVKEESPPADVQQYPEQKKRPMKIEVTDEQPMKRYKMEFVGVVLPAPSLVSSSRASNLTLHPTRSSHTISPEPGDTESESEDVDSRPEKSSRRTNNTAQNFTTVKVEEDHAFEIKAKVKKDPIEVDPITIQGRLNDLQCSRYNVTLEPALQWKPVSRKFISNTYGGSDVASYPTISEENVARHGRRHWLFWNSENHPSAPKRPGESGVRYSLRPWDTVRDVDTVKHGFARMSSGKWLYMGDYKWCIAPALTQTEWLLQPDKFHRTWSRLIQEESWGRTVRANIHLRKQLEREPTRRGR